MASIKKILLKKAYVEIDLKKTKTNHFELKAQINGVKGRFILDTGASNSCVEMKSGAKFKLVAEDSDVKAAGAGASEMEIQESQENSIKIGKWKRKNTHLVLFDLNHVNTALENHGAKTVDGIIGADILNSSKAIIDYNKSKLYLKK